MMLNEITVVYGITDDLLKAICHQEDSRRIMSDSEVITASLTASLFFCGNHLLACKYLKEHGLMPNMLSKSRFNRRLHAIAPLIYDLQQQLGMALKQINESTEYLLDSFPVSICDNIRIKKCRLIKSEDYRGYIASKKRYFYGIKIHLLSTKDGIPVEWAFIPGNANDVRGFNLLPFNLPPGSEVYADKAFNHYDVEDWLQEFEQIEMKVIRRKNSSRSDKPWTQYLKQNTRHFIETVFSQITNKFPKFIHAVTFEGLLLKVSSFIFGYTLERSFL